MLPAIRYDPVSCGPGASPFLTMTFPAHWPRLLGRADGLPLVALAAGSDAPIGLALAEVLPDGQSARLLSLFVVPAWRRHGLGTALLGELEGALRRRGLAEVHGSYTEGQAGEPAVEAVLRKCSWEPPRPHLLIVRAGPDAFPALQSSPAFRRRRLPAGYAYGLWTEVTEAEVAQVVGWMRRGVIPAYLNPFVDAPLVDPRYSLTLRQDGLLVGFLVTHRVAPELLRYSALFVHPDVPVPGLGLYLSLEGLHRLAEAEAAAPVTEVPCATYAGTPLAEFWQRRWLSAVPRLRLSRSRVAGKWLTEPPPSEPWRPRFGLVELPDG